MEESQRRIAKSKIPEGAVMLTKYEALQEQSSLILNWKPQSEVWPLIHGRGILSITASLSAFYINSRFRRTLKLRHINHLPVVITLTAGPALLTALFHTQIVTNKLLLLEVSCPLCLELKGGMIQSFFGLVIPVLTTPLVNFAMIGSKAHNVPYAHEIKKVSSIVRSVFKPIIPTLGIIFVFQALFGAYITYLEVKSYLRVLDVLYLFEQEKKSAKTY